MSKSNYCGGNPNNPNNYSYPVYKYSEHTEEENREQTIREEQQRYDMEHGPWRPGYENYT